MTAPELIGFRFSVYTWIARLALAERGVAYTETDVNPFDDPQAGPHWPRC